MYLTSNFYEKNKSEVYVYIEKFNKERKYVLFDFVDSNEFSEFNAITAFEYNWQDKATMVEVLNYSHRNLKEGVTYRIPYSAISEIAQRIQIVEDSLLIGFRLELANEDSELFGKSKTFNSTERFFRGMDHTNRSDLSQNLFKFKPIDEVVVRKIGQGSWNELLSKGNHEIIFDFGTIYTTKRSEILQMIGDRNTKYTSSKPIFILSHWDVDHYHFLLGFDDVTIKAVRYFIYRADIPNLTARKALGRFITLNNRALRPIATVSPHPQKSSIKLLNIDITGNGDILLQNACKSRSRNRSGLGLTIRKKGTCVIFSGDYDYHQISNDILPVLNYNCNHYLVVPHHGGNAGNFVYNNSNKNILVDAVISVGLNPYRPPHPHGPNISSLKSKGFSIVRTDILTGDHSINL